MFTPSFDGLLTVHNGIGHGGRDAEAIIGRADRIEQRRIVGVLQRCRQAFIQFDRNHGKLPFAIAFYKLNGRH